MYQINTLKLMTKALVALLLLASTAFAQSGHGVQLTWTENDPLYPTTTFNVYRLNAACPASGTAGFTKLNSTAITPEIYFDPSPAAVGSTLCYYITAVAGGLESAPSPTAQVTFSPPPLAPSIPKAVIQ
jgi:hypothetical protein